MANDKPVESEKAEIILSDELKDKVIIYFDSVSIEANRWKIDYESWADYINDEFNINIDIKSYPIERIKKGTYLYLKNEVVQNGLYKEFGLIDILYALKNEGLIRPFIIKDNITWESLPDSINKAYTDDSGNIWALPGGQYYYYYARFFSKEYLDEYNLNPPNNLNEMYELLLFINNKLKVPGLLCSKDTLHTSYNFTDIFHAYECFIYRGSTISYNPITNSFEDHIIHPNMEEALLYIKNLFQSGLVEEVSTRGYRTIGRSQNEITYLNEILNYKTFHHSYPDYAVLGLTLPEKDKKIPVYTFSSFFYILPTESLIDNKALWEFIDIMYDLSYGYNSANYGIINKDYEIREDEIFIYKDNHFHYQPILDLPELKKKSSVLEVDNVKLDYTSTHALLYEYFNPKPDEVFYIKPILNNVNYDTVNMLGEIILKLKNVPVNELIDEYRNQMKTKGMQDELDKLNEDLLGNISLYRY